MANRDFPSGMRPIHEGGSARPRLTQYAVGASETIYAQSPMKFNAAGTVSPQNATTNVTNAIGVAAHYVATGAGESATVLVWDDPKQRFIIQADDSGTALTAADIGLNIDFAASPEVGDATTRQSTCEAAQSTAAATATLMLRILGKVDRIDNTWGNFVDLIVMWRTGVHKLDVALGL